MSAVSPAVRCAEKIVLLQLISPLPGEPSSVAPHSVPGKFANQDDEYAEKRNLSLRQESEITSALAFLSRISNDSNHITAVCLEEVPAGGGCKVLLAINKLKPTCGQTILDRVQRGFEQIFTRLRNISPASPREHRDNIQAAIFNDIIALCRNRILRRLRVKATTAPSSQRARRFIGDHLVELLRFPWHIRQDRPDMTQDHLRQYRARSQALLGHLHNFKAANGQRHEDVMTLVGHIAQFMAEVPLEDIATSLEDHPMQDSAKYRLYDCLSKIARYKESALLLCRMAKTVSILRNVTVEQVSLEQAAFQRPPEDIVLSSLDTTLTAIPHEEGVLGIEALPQWVQGTRCQFNTEVKKVMQESKIHAEVQIIAHYEVASTEVVPPRVIASSKDACYLCHAFIKLHGKYSVPGSHGKLYPGWRLPATRRFEVLGDKLHDFLEQQVRANIERLTGVTKRPRVTLPNESTLFQLIISSSTNLSNLSCLDLPSQVREDAAAGQAHTIALEDEKDPETKDGQQLQDPHHTSSSSSTLSRVECSIGDAARSCSETETGREAGGSSADDRTTVFEVTAKQHKETKSRLIPRTPNKMTPAPDSDKRSVRSIVTKPQGRGHALPEPMVFKTGRFRRENMEIFIEDPSGATTMRCLSPTDSAEVLRDQEVEMVDVLSLTAGTDTLFLRKDSEGFSYFAFGGQVFMVEASEKIEVPSISS